MTITAARWLEVLAYCGVRLLACEAGLFRQVGLLATTRGKSADVRNSGCWVDSIADATQGNVGVNAEVPCRSVDALKGHGSHRNGDVRALVLGALFRRSSPSAVVGRVVQIWVYSVYGVLRRWARAHVRQERFERFVPAAADADSSATPIGVVLVVGIATSALHAEPCSVLGGNRVAPLVAVSRHLPGSLRDELLVGSKLLSPLRCQAPARSGRAAAEIRSCRHRDVPAVALAFPHARPFGLRKDGQPTEAKACDVDELHAVSIGTWPRYSKS